MLQFFEGCLGRDANTVMRKERRAIDKEQMLSKAMIVLLRARVGTHRNHTSPALLHEGEHGFARGKRTMLFQDQAGQHQLKTTQGNLMGAGPIRTALVGVMLQPIGGQVVEASQITCTRLARGGACR